MNMSTMGWFREYLIAKSAGAVWNPAEDFAIRVCMTFPEAENLKKYVIDCADAYIDQGECTPEKGKTLFFALETTGEEKYRETIRQVMAELNAAPVETATLEKLYAELPFRMAYEMKLNGMEKVGQVAAAFRSAHAKLWDAREKLHRAAEGEGFSLRSEAWFLMALADSVALCADQLYEHWRAMVDIYRETLSGVLHRMNAKGMLTADPTDAESAPDAAATAIVLYALLQGVRQGLIDPERYLPVACKGMAALRLNGETRAAEMMEEVFGVR
ncbi:MAG: glycoside hydrolase family 88 protein [Clostridia bacterium]|nr:glycoside hydrolase family 88 protein [Clostridia bacterium]